MAIEQYTRNNTNGLIFHIDAANPKSYRGEAVTNFYGGKVNTYPSYGNGWGTYNTNQYCGNNGCGVYWTIPSISSVSNNVVTTSSVHQMRTYDVVRPQTSGGGLTAGTDYYVKAISSTQFTLHSYSYSQDGYEGFRVLDSIVRDDRISINATNFPTSWWGAPHLPNSGIIKTIIPNGFNHEGRIHDCLRMNWYRPDGVTDGMAYGVNPGLSNRQNPHTFSCYMRAANSAAVGRTVNWQIYSSANASTFVSRSHGPLSTEWQRFTMTATPWSGNPGGTTIYSYWFPEYSPMAVDVSEIQCEENDVASRFVPGTRSTNVLNGSSRNGDFEYDNYFYAGGWSDMSKLQLNGSLSNGNPQWSPEYGGVIQFNGNDGFTFDTSNDQSFDCQEQTVIVWAKTNATTQNGFWFEKGSVNTQFSLFQEGAAIQWRHNFRNNGLHTQSTTAASYINTTNYFQVAGTYNGNNKITYINGAAVTTSGTIRDMVEYHPGAVTIGMYNSGSYFYNGNIAIVMVYNRALSAAEILENYNKYKGRFGLS